MSAWHGSARDASLLLPRGAKANGQKMEMGELVSMETGHPVDSRSHVCARILSNKGRPGRSSGSRLTSSVDPGWGCAAISCFLSAPSLPHPRFPNKHICAEQLSFWAFLTLARVMLAKS